MPDNIKIPKRFWAYRTALNVPADSTEYNMTPGMNTDPTWDYMKVKLLTVGGYAQTPGGGAAGSVNIIFTLLPETIVPGANIASRTWASVGAYVVPDAVNPSSQPLNMQCHPDLILKRNESIGIYLTKGAPPTPYGFATVILEAYSLDTDPAVEQPVNIRAPTGGVIPFLRDFGVKI